MDLNQTNASRLAIFTLQLITIATLLWLSEPGNAFEGEADTGHTVSCDSQCQKNSPEYNNIPVPSQYIHNPPEAGFWYRRSGRDGGGQVWVPGMTDTMNSDTLDIYNRIKNGTLKNSWSSSRKKVADVLLITQNNKKANCYDDLEAAQSGNVIMVCDYRENGKKVSSEFSNLVTGFFDDHLDNNFTTVAEKNDLFTVSDNSNTTGTDPANPSNSPRATSSNASNTSASTYELKKSSYSTGLVDSNQAYSRYINQHVAPNFSTTQRSTASVFSAGDEKTLTLEEVLKKQKAEYSPGTVESRATKKDSTNSQD